MNEKKKMIALSVTTQEALDLCVSEKALLFCIENPLYSALCSQSSNLQIFQDYDSIDYPEKQVMMLKKVRGNPVFDDLLYEPFYLPLSWDSWIS